MVGLEQGKYKMNLEFKCAIKKEKKRREREGEKMQKEEEEVEGQGEQEGQGRGEKGRGERKVTCQKDTGVNLKELTVASAGTV